MIARINWYLVALTKVIGINDTSREIRLTAAEDAHSRAHVSECKRVSCVMVLQA